MSDLSLEQKPCLNCRGCGYTPRCCGNYQRDDYSLDGEICCGSFEAEPCTQCDAYEKEKANG